MKTELVLKKMMLLGFMLMAVSINVFANKANEEKNTTNVVVERLINRSMINPDQPIILNERQVTEWLALPEQVGYECTDWLIDGENTNCVEAELAESLRNVDNAVYRFVKLVARAVGRAVLRLVYTPVDGGNTTIVINIQIIVNR